MPVLVQLGRANKRCEKRCPQYTKNNYLATLDFNAIVSHITMQKAQINKQKGEKMADPNKYKSVSVPMDTYKILVFLGDGKLTDANLTISKTIEVLAKKEAKNKGYKNGHGK